MSSLISCQDLSRTIGARTLFSGLSVSIHDGDRVGVVGRNGSGKTTLLRLLAGEEESETGIIHRQRGLRITHVPQVASFDPAETVVSIVDRAARAAQAADPSRAEDETERQVRVNIVLGQTGFDDPEQAAGGLSGGWRRRLAIAAALAGDPALLLLDEPTNHLDLQGILWLEGLLTERRLALVVISHDRTFLDNVANRMLEIDPRYPGGFYTVNGGYREFLEQRRQYLEGRAQYQQSLANRVRRELDWLGHGPKARTAKAQARVQEAARLQEELAEMRRQAAATPAGIELLGSGRKTKRLLVARGIGKELGGRRLLDGLDLLLQPGQRLGVVGGNGCGKSTLLRLLAGELEPDQGWLRRADKLQVVYFDQGREQLDQEQSLRHALAGRSDSVLYRGREIHVVGWAQRFQFQVEQLDQPVAKLSGGEQARVLIARLMLRPADLLLLDEPTNDLDITTLEVLEECLLDFPGALALVTHDRLLLDRVTTVLLGLDGRGGITFFADVDQWQQALLAPVKTAAPRQRRAREPRPRKAGLSYLEKQEYAAMEERILAAEEELAAAQAGLEDPAIATDAEATHRAYRRCEAAQEQVEQLYQRWAALEQKQQQQ